jgi:hypothetical protein
MGTKGEQDNDAVDLYPELNNDQVIESRSQNTSDMNLSPSQPVTASPAETLFDFWKVNSYKKTVKRIDDGGKLCDDLLKMISERSEIESQHANKLQGM